MGKNFKSEISALADTYQAAFSQDVKALSIAVQGMASRELIAIGSGGSFTTASVMAEFHEKATGLLARAVTPLEYISNPLIAAKKSVIIFSAEGNNNDIVEALRVASKSAPSTLDIITNTLSSRLNSLSRRVGLGRVHSFPVPSGKDGYLAVNTVIMTMCVLARVYSRLSLRFPKSLPRTLHELNKATGRAAHPDVPVEMLRKNTICLLYDPELKAAAIDFESKLNEAAITNVSVADIRSFAHGRHLWLARFEDSTSIIALTSNRNESLWAQFSEILPSQIPAINLLFRGEYPANLLSAMTAVMEIVSTAGSAHGIDPGQPNVPDFGRRLFHQPIRHLVPPRNPASSDPVADKVNAFGTRLVGEDQSEIRKRYKIFVQRLAGTTFDALVCDYDGTLCEKTKRDEPLDQGISDELNRLLRANIDIGFASGRGGSLLEALRNAIDREFWPRVSIGVYNGRVTQTLDQDLRKPPEIGDQELIGARKVISDLKRLSAPIKKIQTQPGQLSVHVSDGADLWDLWRLCAESLFRNNLGNLRVFTTSHSVDILSTHASKANLFEFMNKEAGRKREFLALGDQFAWPGNDYEMLSQAICLSCGATSLDIDNGWNIAHSGKQPSEAARSYLKALTASPDGTFVFKISNSLAVDPALVSNDA